MTKPITSQAIDPMRYRKKPVETEVMGPITRENCRDIAKWIGGRVGTRYSNEAVFLDVERWSAFLGEYILRFPDGTFQAWAPDEFNKEWERNDLARTVTESQGN